MECNCHILQDCKNSSWHRHIACSPLGYSSLQPPNLKIDFLKCISLKKQASAHKVFSSDLLLAPPLLALCNTHTGLF